MKPIWYSWKDRETDQWTVSRAQKYTQNTLNWPLTDKQAQYNGEKGRFYNKWY